MNALTQRSVDRRRFLRASGVALSLPWLESIAKGAANSEQGAHENKTPTRFLGICNNLGLLPEEFFPKQAGHDYVPSPT